MCRGSLALVHSNLLHGSNDLYSLYACLMESMLILLVRSLVRFYIFDFASMGHPFGPWYRRYFKIFCGQRVVGGADWIRCLFASCRFAWDLQFSVNWIHRGYAARWSLPHFFIVVWYSFCWFASFLLIWLYIICLVILPSYFGYGFNIGITLDVGGAGVNPTWIIHRTQFTCEINALVFFYMLTWSQRPVGTTDGRLNLFRKHCFLQAPQPCLFGILAPRLQILGPEMDEKVQQTWSIVSRLKGRHCSKGFLILVARTLCRKENALENQQREEDGAGPFDLVVTLSIQSLLHYRRAEAKKISSNVEKGLFADFSNTLPLLLRWSKHTARLFASPFARSAKRQASEWPILNSIAVFFLFRLLILVVSGKLFLHFYGSILSLKDRWSHVTIKKKIVDCCNSSHGLSPDAVRCAKHSSNNKTFDATITYLWRIYRATSACQHKPMPAFPHHNCRWRICHLQEDDSKSILRLQIKKNNVRNEKMCTTRCLHQPTRPDMSWIKHSSHQSRRWCTKGKCKNNKVHDFLNSPFECRLSHPKSNGK